MVIVRQSRVNRQGTAEIKCLWDLFTRDSRCLLKRMPSEPEQHILYRRCPHHVNTLFPWLFLITSERRSIEPEEPAQDFCMGSLHLQSSGKSTRVAATNSRKCLLVRQSDLLVRIFAPRVLGGMGLDRKEE